MLKISFEAHSNDLNGYMPVQFYFRVAPISQYDVSGSDSTVFSPRSALEPFLDPSNGVKNVSKNSIFDPIYLVKNYTFLVTSKIFSPPPRGMFRILLKNSVYEEKRVLVFLDRVRNN